MFSIFSNPSKLLEFFQKIPMAKKMEKLEKQLIKAQINNDLSKLAETYYNMGVNCMKRDDYNRAMVYLCRSDTTFSSRDDIYENVSEEIKEDCSKRIGELENMPLLTNQIIEYIDYLAGYLDDTQIRLWGLMTMARLVKVFNRLSVLPGCEVLGRLDKVVDLVLRSMREPIMQSEFQFIYDICNQLYELEGSKNFSNMIRQVEIPGSYPIQVFDLNGLLVLTELNIYLDAHLRMLNQKQDESMPETGLIPCALLPDYYLLTDKGILNENLNIQKEIERIQSDFDFICSSVDWNDISERVLKYKDLDILLGC